jgi:quercetin dioxygenase-like cupin family protein
MRISIEPTADSRSTRSLTLLLLLIGLTLLTVTLAARTSNATSETQRFPQFENAHVKVWRSVISPNAPLPPHRHDHGRVIIPLQGGTMKIVDQTGAAEIHEWKQGTAYWLPANAPNTTHSDVNTGDHPIEVMVVEVEDDK